MQMPIEVILKVDDVKLDTKELHLILQDIADDWYWSKVTNIPCSYISNESK
jgi:hypothetical protein